MCAETLVEGLIVSIRRRPRNWQGICKFSNKFYVHQEVSKQSPTVWPRNNNEIGNEERYAVIVKDCLPLGQMLAKMRKCRALENWRVGSLKNYI